MAKYGTLSKLPSPKEGVWFCDCPAVAAYHDSDVRECPKCDYQNPNRKESNGNVPEVTRLAQTH